jgi:hypothetical protein
MPMRSIKAITTMKVAHGYGYLIATCEDNTVWARAFPVEDEWHQMDGIMDDDEIYMANHVKRQKSVNAD